MSYNHYDKENKVLIPIAGGGGSGVPAGGTTGQVLKKKSNTDYDVEWGEGGGASSSSISITNSTNDLTGETVTIKLSGVVLTTATVGDIVPVSTLGNYVVECGVYSVNVSVIAFGASYTADLTTANSWQLWVDASGLDHTDYADLSEVLADEKAIRRLMTIHASVDFLAQSNKNATLISTIINNDYCAKWINLRDYALDTLYANSDIASLMDTADKYFYGEWALVGQVPKMTSNTAPYGTASASSERILSGNILNYAYYAFDNNDSTNWLAQDGSLISNTYLKYTALNAFKPKRIRICTGTWSSSYVATYNLKIQGSNDDITYVDITEVLSESDKDPTWHEFVVTTNEAYKYYKLVIPSASTEYAHQNSGYQLWVYGLQFYAWQPKGNVPIMTSDTAPYGEASVNSAYSNDYAAYKSFDNSWDTFWFTAVSTTNNYISYKFTNPVCVKNVKMVHFYNTSSSYVVPSRTWTVRGSNDGSTWENLGSVTLKTGTAGLSENVFTDLNIDNDNYYLYYSVFCADIIHTSGQWSEPIRTLQFYGRELKVSVPTMTSNTQPWGEASASAVDGSNYAWNAFDNDASTFWDAVTAKNAEDYVEFDFKHNYRILEMSVYTGSPSGTYVMPFEGRFEYYDGTDWHLYGEAYSKSYATREKYTFTQQQDVIANKLRFYSKNKAQHTGSLLVYAFNIYGLDYSEYDWDTDNPRHYIYDHGVELEEIRYAIGSAGDNKIEKYSDYIELIASSTASRSGTNYASMNYAMDLTPYKVFRACIGMGDYNTGEDIGVYQKNAFPSGGSYNGTAKVSIMASISPYNNPYTAISINIESVNGEYDNVIFCGWDTNRRRTITEWWLE